MRKIEITCANRKHIQTILSSMESLDLNWKKVCSALRFHEEQEPVKEELLRQIDDAAQTCNGDGVPAKILDINVEDKSVTLMTPMGVTVKVYRDEQSVPQMMSSTFSGTRVYGLPDKLDGWSISIDFGRDSRFLARQIIARVQTLGYEVTWEEVGEAFHPNPDSLHIKDLEGRIIGVIVWNPDNSIYMEGMGRGLMLTSLKDGDFLWIDTESDVRATGELTEDDFFPLLTLTENEDC